EAPYYFQDADGEVREMTLLCSTTPLSMGEESLVLVTLLDITQRKQMEEERERLVAEVSAQARQLQAILDTVPQGVLLLDDEGGILHANPMAEKALAVLARAREGDALSRLGDRPLAELLTSPPVKGLWHEVKVDGSTFEVIARPVEQGAAPERWVLVLNDVTREREVQTQLQQQERLATVGQLAGGIAHDFNNILGVIILYAGMLAQSEALTDQDRERAAIIREQGWQASRLIQQILDFSRRALLERQPLDLLPLLKEQVKMLQRTLPEHIEIVLNHREDQYVVSADLTRIQQMIMNLALNARDAMPEGGTLRIGLDKIEVRPGESPLLPEMEAGEWVQLTVSDTGTGITPDVLPHIFEPFFTTKGPGKGSGLGLAQVEGIVGQHGGRIGVTTELGRGTTFTVYLPALAARPTEPPTADVSIMPQGRGEMVLVVEDQEAVRTALVQSLEQMNYRTLEAANGEQALAVMQERGEQVALVLSDVVMPGIGGIRLLHALREQGWQTPVILLTGHAMRENLENLQAQGLSAWLPKPPNLEQLAQAIAGALGSTNGDLLQGEEGKS
ncbi:MAG TPA: PAS domain-containing sensor histidine kinase, partial [Chloroflexi bacterium]|nr:PAS domain-containing sensor histidine kinase [Chloroflexota bacterium]